jgi:hypothetical protein
MSVTTRRLLRFVLALALVGAGPATRIADALLFHSAGTPAGLASQADDGTRPLGHGDACTLAARSAPVTPAPACDLAPVLAETVADRAVAPPFAVPETRAGRSPPSRAPPTLLS